MHLLAFSPQSQVSGVRSSSQANLAQGCVHLTTTAISNNKSFKSCYKCYSLFINRFWWPKPWNFLVSNPLSPKIHCGVSHRSGLRECHWCLLDSRKPKKAHLLLDCLTLSSLAHYAKISLSSSPHWLPCRSNSYWLLDRLFSKKRPSCV